jgi:hypothetical protein
MPLKELFVGPDDSDTCDGCRAAINGNPYPIDSAPAPGSLECGNRCRHMVQIDGDSESQDALLDTKTWSARIEMP